MSDVVFHYNNLLAFQQNKHFLQDTFPRKLDMINVTKLELVYERMLADNEVMQELEQITQYALSEIEGNDNRRGRGVYEFVEKQLQIEPIGIVPLYKNEGYVFLRYGTLSEVRIIQLQHNTL